MKLIKRLGLVAVVAGLMTIVLIQGLSGVGSAATSDPCYCTRPRLALSLQNVYWGSYINYTSRLLSVDYDITNWSTNYANAHNVQIVGTTDSGGVILVDHGRTINMVSAGECELITLKYLVPPGVAAFTSRVHAVTSDQCGNSYTYGGPS